MDGWMDKRRERYFHVSPRGRSGDIIDASYFDSIKPSKEEAKLPRITDQLFDGCIALPLGRMDG